PVNFTTDWFMEFYLTRHARLSIADEKRSTVKSAAGRGITVTLEVEEIEPVHERIHHAGLQPTGITRHAWDAKVFHLRDPEGNRLEVWQSTDDDRLS
ncbi:MAG TPA: VOC family protein, partial [Desulfosarcina sp.]|nr:VOC family protein [Desulfosarcina sp.]